MSELQQNSSPLACGKRLKKLRNMAGLLLKDISNKYGVGLSTLKFWENGYGNGLSKKGAAKIITIIRQNGVQCTLEWLLYGVGPKPQLQDVQYGKGQVEGSSLILKEDAAKYEILVAQEIELFCQHHANSVIMTVSDDGMQPYYSQGDRIGGLYVTAAAEIAVMVGENCIVETADQQIFCRRFVKNPNADLFNLFCVNPLTTVIEPILYNMKLTKVAPIIRVWKRPI
ncbi:MAG: helix-turn-helix transcriptional regulator [Candidatus Neomarinimicrobiota bacterium]